MLLRSGKATTIILNRNEGLRSILGIGKKPRVMNTVRIAFEEDREHCLRHHY